MASEMVERVAKAIAADHARKTGVVLSVNPPWAPYRTQARAAIEAMREPTDAMVKAAENTALHDIAWAEGQLHDDGRELIEFHRTMIDAALKD